jgi:starch synthase
MLSLSSGPPEGIPALRILYASSEIAPFAKTGGLADVGGALPNELANLGHEVTLVMPAYPQIHEAGLKIEPVSIDLDVPIGGKSVHGRILHTKTANDKVEVYFVDQPQYFGRPGLYQENGEDYRDNCERFVCFCRAAMEIVRLLELEVDVIHCNDWQTGLIPALLKIEYSKTDRFRDVASLLTTHNLAYQGSFWHWDMLLTGLDWKYFNWHQMECHGRLNLLKTGIVFADAINTVSPRYAEEIQTGEFSCGLDGVLQQRRDVLSGIINGIDYGVWNPATDSYLPHTYDVDTWRVGKAACKSSLQEELGLPVDPSIPLIGIVGRLSDQKGWSLITDVMEQWVQFVEAQWAILGVGTKTLQRILTKLADRYPAKVRARFQFSEALAHQIEGGSDIELMPSRYEPCGLNQLFSLKYGTVPVVRETGGLADTVVDATEEALENGTATGFSFKSYDADSLDAVLRHACDVFAFQPDVWNQLVETGMKQDWSWKRSAADYARLYEATVTRHRSVLVR